MCQIMYSFLLSTVVLILIYTVQGTVARPVAKRAKRSEDPLSSSEEGPVARPVKKKAKRNADPLPDPSSAEDLDFELSEDSESSSLSSDSPTSSSSSSSDSSERRKKKKKSSSKKSR